eukprot:scaffold18977_cov76-Skeletonema_dohrnii-CCMP3373.AAC.6
MTVTLTHSTKPSSQQSTHLARVKQRIGSVEFSFNPAEPKYHRLLIGLLARAQKYAAAQVKAEQTEVEENEATDVTTIKQEQCATFDEDYAASEEKVDGEGVDADDDEARSEVKRPKLTTPSPPLDRVKEEPTEFDDHDETISTEGRAPINRINNYTPAAPKVEDKDQLMCSVCKGSKFLDSFSKNQRRRGEKVKMRITWDLITVKCIECIGRHAVSPPRHPRCRPPHKPTMTYVWDPFKTKLLIEAVLVIGFNWVTIAAIVSCTNVQAQTRFQTLMKSKDFSNEFYKAAKKLESVMKKLVSKTNPKHKR